MQRLRGKPQQNYLRGALNLSIATAAVKVIGALYKVPIQNILGEAGSSLYDVAYTIYTFLFVLATAGLPVAISKMVSESVTSGRDDAERIFSVAFVLLFGVGTGGALIMFFGAGPIAAAMNAPNAAWAIRAIAPSVFLVGFICPYRGYYQGHGNMTPTAVSQVIEALGKLVFGIGLTFFALKVIIPADGTPETQTQRDTIGSAAAILGVSLGILMSAVYLINRSRKMGLLRERAPAGKRRPRRELLREMISVAIPITLGSAVLNITNLIDSGMTRGLLVSGAGFTEAQRDLYHGAYSWARTLFNLPSSFVLTLAVSLLPAIAACRVRRDMEGVRQTTRSAIRITALLGMPAGVGFICLAEPMLKLLYPLREEGVRIAAPLLQTLGVAVIFVCLVTVTNSVLQSLGLVYIPIISMALGSVAKLVCTYVMVSNPVIHINGAPVGNIICYGLIAALNLSVVIRTTGTGLSLLTELVKPLLASAGMGVIALGCYHFFSNFIGTRPGVILAIAAGVLAYFILLLLIRGLPKRDLLLLPGGAKLARFLQIR